MRNFELLREFKSQSCQVCGKRPTDPCHIKSVGSGGADVSDNLISLCRNHHTEQHNIGWPRFSNRHKAIEWHLETKGWKVVEELGRKKLQHPEMGNA